MPVPVRVGTTFALVLIAWVFFRADDLPHALRYLTDMAGLGEPQPGHTLLAGIVYTPYYIGTFALAALIVWSAPQTWEWTMSLNARKVAAVATLLALSIAALTTQAYNPFIYFIF
jgi:alginate O-acetyltransferase complex protein AlgI